MGYHARTTDIDLRLRLSNSRQILEVLQSHIACAEPTDVCDALDYLSWSVRVNDMWFEFEYFDGDRLGDTEDVLRDLAPYFEDHNYVEFSGEDDILWRWVFYKGVMVEIQPTITWPDMDRISELVEEATAGGNHADHT